MAIHLRDELLKISKIQRMNRFLTCLDFDAQKHSVKVEMMAGLTTFLTISYILVVNPIILGDAGMDKGAVAGKDFVKDPGLHRTMLGDGLACLAASLLGGPPVTTYSEVTGAMQITRVTHPQVIRIAAVTAIIFSVIGKLNALLQSIPTAVLGGIMLLLFGSIAGVGIQNLLHHKVDLRPRLEPSGRGLCALHLHGRRACGDAHRHQLSATLHSNVEHECDYRR